MGDDGVRVEMGDDGAHVELGARPGGSGGTGDGDDGNAARREAVRRVPPTAASRDANPAPAPPPRTRVGAPAAPADGKDDVLTQVPRRRVDITTRLAAVTSPTGGLADSAANTGVLADRVFLGIPGAVLFGTYGTAAVAKANRRLDAADEEEDVDDSVDEPDSFPPLEVALSIIKFGERAGGGDGKGEREETVVPVDPELGGGKAVGGGDGGVGTPGAGGEPGSGSGGSAQAWAAGGAAAPGADSRDARGAAQKPDGQLIVTLRAEYMQRREARNASLAQQLLAYFAIAATVVLTLARVSIDSRKMQRGIRAYFIVSISMASVFTVALLSALAAIAWRVRQARQARARWSRRRKRMVIAFASLAALQLINSIFWLANSALQLRKDCDWYAPASISLGACQWVCWTTFLLLATIQAHDLCELNTDNETRIAKSLRGWLGGMGDLGGEEVGRGVPAEGGGAPAEGVRGRGRGDDAAAAAAVDLEAAPAGAAFEGGPGSRPRKATRFEPEEGRPAVFPGRGEDRWEVPDRVPRPTSIATVIPGLFASAGHAGVEWAREVKQAFSEYALSISKFRLMGEAADSEDEGDRDADGSGWDSEGRSSFSATSGLSVSEALVDGSGGEETSAESPTREGREGLSQKGLSRLDGGGKGGDGPGSSEVGEAGRDGEAGGQRRSSWAAPLLRFRGVTRRPRAPRRQPGDDPLPEELGPSSRDKPRANLRSLSWRTRHRGGESRRRRRGEPVLILDAPLWIHAPKLIPWAAMVGLVVANSVHVSRTPEASIVPAPGESMCKSQIDSCREDVMDMRLNVAIAGVIAVFYFSFLAYVIQSSKDMRRHAFPDVRSIRLQSQLYTRRMVLSMFVMLVYFVLSLLTARRSCWAYIFGWLGSLPLQALGTGTALALVYSFLPQRPRDPRHSVPEAWRQEMTWTEDALPRAIAARAARAVFTGHRRDASELAGVPMFCFQTAIGALYWSQLAYEAGSSARPGRCDPRFARKLVNALDGNGDRGREEGAPGSPGRDGLPASSGSSEGSGASAGVDPVPGGPTGRTGSAPGEPTGRIDSAPGELADDDSGASLAVMAGLWPRPENALRGWYRDDREEDGGTSGCASPASASPQRAEGGRSGAAPQPAGDEAEAALEADARGGEPEESYLLPTLQGSGTLAGGNGASETSGGSVGRGGPADALKCDPNDQIELLWNRQTDTKATLACSDHTLVVAFSGTASMANVKTDLRLSQTVHPPERKGVAGSSFGIRWMQTVRVHAGFLRAYTRDGYRESLLARVAAMIAERSPRRLLVTGHSLGGALATLAAHDLARAHPGLETTLYTFGCPRVGNRAFAREIADLVPHSFAVICGQDPVPRVPKGFSYKRSSRDRVVIVQKGDIVVRPSFVEMSALGSGLGKVSHHYLDSHRKVLRVIIKTQFGPRALRDGARGVISLTRRVDLNAALFGRGLRISELRNPHKRTGEAVYPGTPPESEGDADSGAENGRDGVGTIPPRSTPGDAADRLAGASSRHGSSDPRSHTGHGAQGKRASRGISLSVPCCGTGDSDKNEDVWEVVAPMPLTPQRRSPSDRDATPRSAGPSVRQLAAPTGSAPRTA